jgi:RNA polymerase subunit RPABC4/transcription elongation factor Spt4
MSENKAKCPYCEQLVPDDWMDVLADHKGMMMRKKCKYCKRFIGITQDITGDLVAFELKPKR